METYQGKCGACAFITEAVKTNEKAEQQLAAHERATGHVGEAH